MNEYKNEYWNCIFIERCKDQERRNNLRKIIAKDCLYRYRPFNENTLKEIALNEIYLSHPDFLNDPYDCHFPIYLDNEYVKATLNDDPDSIKVVTNSIEGELNKLKKSMRNFGIASFSEDYDSMLMWSHYSKNHEGICIGYDFKEIEELNNKSNISSQTLMPVKYSNKKQNIYINNRIINIDYLPQFLFKKSKHWDYENEWRLMRRFKENIKGEAINFIKPKEIYLGSNMDENNIKLIKKLTDGKNIKLYKVYIRDDEFKLDFTEII